MPVQPFLWLLCTPQRLALGLSDGHAVMLQFSCYHAAVDVLTRAGVKNEIVQCVAVHMYVKEHSHWSKVIPV
jgi:hypothetical protein